MAFKLQTHSLSPNIGTAIMSVLLMQSLSSS